MNKKVLIVLSLAVFVLLSACSRQKNEVEKEWRAAPLDGGKSLEIARYAGEKQIIEIPSRLHGMSVTGIGSRAFREKELIRVTIPNSITSIGNGAFDNNLLTAVTIPNSVTSIGNSAFSNNLLTAVTIPGNVTSIGDSAFAGNQLTSITIPKNVATIGRNAFTGNKITRVTIGADLTLNNSFGSGFEAVYNVGKLAGTYGRRDTEDTSRWGRISGQFLVIGLGTSGITIASYTGSGSTLTIPESIEGIPVTAIGNGAFTGCELTSVTIPNSVTSIGQNAFEGNKLTSIAIPDSVTSIGAGAFAGNQLSDVEIPDKVTTIGEKAFAGNQLTSIAIPARVTTFSVNAFSDNPGFSAINISPENLNFSSADGIVYSKAGTALLMWPNGKTPVSIPNNVTSIGNAVFMDFGLTSITIPDSVTAIGNNAFRNNQLTSVAIPNSVRRIGDGAFSGNQLSSFSIGANVELGNGAIDSTFENRYRRATNNFDFVIGSGFGRAAGTYARTQDFYGTNWSRR
ncbi:MAG: leucine-rich repeat domain-containing protein [Treponema sp.]|jgi:hypothetical protein|nr:leucine-rich repeat domain-containing protein [Treponema sp.]